MQYREIIAVCSEIHTKHINTLCGQDVEFGGTKSYHCAIQQQIIREMPTAEQVTLTRLTKLGTVEGNVVTTDTVCTYSSRGIHQL
jgi:hypothetical protein